MPSSLRRPRRAAVLALLILVTAAAAWLWAHEGHQPLSSSGVTVHADPPGLTLGPEVEAALRLRTAEVEEAILAEHLRGAARAVTPWGSHAYATTRVAGRVASIHVRPGQPVTAGEGLADIESLELETLQLEYRSAWQDLRLAEANREQLESASARGSVSAQSVYEARNRQREQENAVSLARRKLGMLGLAEADVERLKDVKTTPIKVVSVRSPLGGVVRHVDVRPGQVVEPTQHLFEVVDPSRLQVEVEVLERDWGRVGPGLALTVRWPGGGMLRAVVEGKGRALDFQTHAGVVWATVRADEAAGLTAGTRGQAELPLPGAKAATVVPLAAVVHDGMEAAVFVQTGPRQFERKAITLGRQDGDRVEVLGGVYLGDRVVTAGSHQLASFLPATVLRPCPEAVRQAGLRVEPARRHPVAEVVQMPGAVELPPARRAAVASRLGGTVDRLHVWRDQPVRKGDVVAELTSLEFQDLQLDLLRAHLQLELQEQTLQPLRSLSAAGNGGVSDRQLRDLEAAARTTRLRRDSLANKLRSAGLTDAQVQGLLERQEVIGTLPMRAPTDGWVVRSGVALGQVIKADEPLFEIHDFADAEVRGQASERQAARLRVGQRARMRLADGALLDGVVARLDPIVDNEDRSLSVWLRVAGLPAELPHGLAIRVAVVVSESEPTLAVPRETVVSEGPRHFLFVRQADGRFERRAVEVGRGDDLRAEILRGLTEGEEVAVRGADSLQTGYAGLK